MTIIRRILMMFLAFCTFIVPAAGSDFDMVALKIIKKSNGKKILPATTQIIKDTPSGEFLTEVLWSSVGCAPVNGSAKWIEVSGFVPKIVISGSKMYMYCPITQLSDIAQAWIEGEISADGKEVVFPTPQAYMINEATPGQIDMLYAGRLNAATGKYEEGNKNLVFSYEDGTLVQTDGGVLGLIDDKGNFYGYGERDIKVTRIDETLVPLPENAEIATYVVNYDNQNSAQRQSARIAVAGDDFYFSDPLGSTDIWFRGTSDGNTITVSSRQYMGSQSGYPMYLVVAEEYYRTEINPMGQPQQVLDYKIVSGKDIVFVMNNETGEISTDQIILLSSSPTERGTACYALKNPVYSPWTATRVSPANPVITGYVDLNEYMAYGLSGCMVVFEIPAEDPDGGFIPQEDIYYTIKFDSTPLSFYDTEKIPYYGQFQDSASKSAITISGKSHQLQVGINPEKMVSIQSFYMYENEMIPSDQMNYLLDDGKLVLGNGSRVDSVESMEVPVAVNYYDLSGRKVNAFTSGLLIRETVMPDGTRNCVKYFNNK